MSGRGTQGKAKRNSLHAIYHRFVYRLSELHTVSGLPVRILWPSEEERSTTLAKVAKALELVAGYDPQRFAYLLRDVAGIHVLGEVGARRLAWRAPAHPVATFIRHCSDDHCSRGRGDVSPRGDACAAIPPRFRLLSGLPSANRRGEFRAEIAFASRLPDASEQVRRAERSLAREAEFWSDEAIRGRSLSDLRSLGAPSWLICCCAGFGTAVPPNETLNGTTARTVEAIMIARLARSGHSHYRVTW